MNVAHAAEGIGIHLAPPVLGYFGDMPITSTLIMVWSTMTLLTVCAFMFRKHIRLVPGKAQVAVEALIGGIFSYTEETLESREHAQRFFPLIMTIFIFVLALNWLGLVPGVDAIGIMKHMHDTDALIPFLHPANTDLNITIGIAVVAFFAIEIAGIFVLGFLKYGSKFLNFSSPLAFLIGIIELFSELARLVSFSFRLFGNIFAGKTLIVIAMFFVPFVLPVPLLAFEFFVGFIQAAIFAVLTLYFIKLAIAEPH
jgi:F-type H+-transporting ATPase subunit a